MARPRVSQFTDVITVHCGDVHLAIKPGDTVDFDQPIGAGTLEQQLGERASGFAEIASASPKPTGRRVTEPAEDKQE